MSPILGLYTTLFSNLHTNVRNEQKAPHKAILLLSVMYLIENQTISTPSIIYDKKLKSTFKRLWKKYVDKSAPFRCVITYPFYHMQSEMFWDLIPKRGKDLSNIQAFTDSEFETYIQNARIDDDLFNLICDEDSRHELEKVLFETYLPGVDIEKLRKPSLKAEKTTLHRESPRKKKEKRVDGLSQSAHLTYEAFISGLSIDEIGPARNLSKGTIIGHLCECISAKKIEIETILATDKIDLISSYIDENGSEVSRKEIFENLDGSVTYDDINLYLSSIRPRVDFEQTSGPRTWLFTWNPTRWAWDDLYTGYQELCSQIKQVGHAFFPWSCGVNTKIKEGDRIFLIRLGDAVKGIVASGYAATSVFKTPHWDLEKAKQGVECKQVYINFDKIVDPYSENILPMELLKEQFPDVCWSTQSSGISIPKSVADLVEDIWGQR